MADKELVTEVAEEAKETASKAKKATKSKYPKRRHLAAADTIKVRITFTDDVLGSSPADPEIFSTYIASKAPDAMSRQEEIEIHGAEEYEDLKTTVFMRHPETGEPLIMSYMLDGFLKSAGAAYWRLGGEYKLSGYKKIVDTMLFISSTPDINNIDRMIPMHLPKGSALYLNQRTLRAQTPQGDRVALASSEAAPKGTWAEFYIILLDSSLRPVILNWLEYGKVEGYGQWRNSGKGTFTTEIWDDTENKYIPIEEVE